LAALVLGRQPGQAGGDVAPLGGQLGLGVGLVGRAPVGGSVIFKGFFGSLPFRVERYSSKKSVDTP